MGKKEDKLIDIRVSSTELGLDLVSEKFSLEAFDDNDNALTKVFTFTVPGDTDEREYILEATTNFDSGRKKDSEFAKLTVSKCGGTTSVPGTTPSETEFSLVQKTIASQPGVIGIPYKVTNAEATTKVFTIEFQPSGAWTTATSSAITVKSGESKSDFMYVVTDKSLKDGSYQGTLTLKQDGTTIGSDAFTVSVGATATPTGQVTYQPTTTSDSFYRNWVDSGRVFWVLGMIVLVVLIIFFVKLIFVKSA